MRKTDDKVTDRFGLSLVIAGPAVLLTLYFTVPFDLFGPDRPVFGWVSFGVGLAVLAGLLLREIRRELLGLPGRPTLMIVLLICLTLVVFAATYYGLAKAPGQFNGLATRVDALYFTVITMSTVGYGDISPVGQEARMVVMLQILYTLVFLTAGATSITRRMRGRFVERTGKGSGR
ncbi:voltage-gated potassium channel Kch [Kitasatospora gansuensis]|uniref:Voltage-gated potassium channel Kch n=1 Tax=Kitasatospora gansuensis TaxID=258050 RepID=A0A7W7WIK4_9ACTN|nr:ion channel [Kitasatospora gansuensis]MBB4948346.1 voltage-gated potassium channel Kch [Kitasatospora gansuensis]